MLRQKDGQYKKAYLGPHTKVWRDRPLIKAQIFNFLRCA